jgi:hypothetical protein
MQGGAHIIAAAISDDGTRAALSDANSTRIFTLEVRLLPPPFRPLP